MKKLWVYADFDWLKEIELIGELSYEILRGSETYGFQFNNEWLKKYGELFLSEDLHNYPGPQYTQQGKDIFGCFSDALPDRWGRTLLNRREQVQAAEEKRPVRRLTSFDYLIGIDDFSRMGGFRFKNELNGDFINLSTHSSINKYQRTVACQSGNRKERRREYIARQKMVASINTTGNIIGRCSSQSQCCR